MRVEPVYLLAAAPDRRIKLSRRAFVGSIAGSALFGGCIGFGARAALGDGAREVAPPAERDDAIVHEAALPVSKTLLWARELAQADVDVLYDNAFGFLAEIDRARDDDVLWQGVDRLIDIVPTRDASRHRTAVAATLLAIMDRLRPDRLTPAARAGLTEALR